jgi:hypothetical protein
VARSSADVPDPASTFCRIGGSSCDAFTVTPGALHGTAVAEIVHDMAPAAALHLGQAFTAGDYVAVIDQFAALGVDVINHSATWPFDGPGDGTGLAAAIVDYAASKGMLWVNAAGNFADGGYWRGTWTDANANLWHEFAPGDEFYGFLCDPGLGLRWDDWASGGRTDFDVWIWDDISQVGNIFAAKTFSLGDQTAGAVPVEFYGDTLTCSGPGDVDFLAISLFDPGTVVGDTLELAV